MSNQHIVAAIISNCKQNFHTSFLYMSASEKNQWDTAKQILITKSDMDLGWCFNFTLGFTLIRHFAICTLQNNETNVLLHSSWTCFLECVLLYLLCFYLWQNQSQFMRSLVSLTWICLSALLMPLYPVPLMMTASWGKCLGCCHPKHLYIYTVYWVLMLNIHFDNMSKHVI